MEEISFWKSTSDSSFFLCVCTKKKRGIWSAFSKRNFLHLIHKGFLKTSGEKNFKSSLNRLREGAKSLVIVFRIYGTHCVSSKYYPPFRKSYFNPPDPIFTQAWKLTMKIPDCFNFCQNLHWNWKPPAKKSIVILKYVRRTNAQRLRHLNLINYYSYEKIQFYGVLLMINFVWPEYQLKITWSMDSCAMNRISTSWLTKLIQKNSKLLGKKIFDWQK